MPTYTVRAGDTLSAIAKRAGVTLDSLKKINPQIADFDKISIGQIINIPEQSTPITVQSVISAPSSISLANDLTTKSSTPSSLPIFKIGVANFAKDANTIHIRKIIKDEFGGGLRGDALQCTEYVQFKIAQKSIVIRWPADRPRHGGRWGEIFEKNKTYLVLLEPKIGCAISFTAGFSGAAATFGHIAYVEGVFPDGSIRITEANWPGDGKYNDRILQRSVWKDKHKCKFIEFS